MTIDLTQYPITVDAFDGNEQRATVFLDRYALKDGNGKPLETHPLDMWDRVSDAMGKDDDQKARFYDLLTDFKFVPGGRILAGAGTGSEVTFYNCYVIPVETKARRKNRATSESWGTELGWTPVEEPGNDSREAIFDTIGLMVDIMSRGGGVGINWSVLRPKGAYLKRVNGTSSGPIGWMDVASKAVGEVEQGGSRRGAAMFMLDDWHPDLLDFIDAKRDMSRITNANVSVAVSDAFMETVEQDGLWTFEFPDTTDPAYDSEWDGDIVKWSREHNTVAYATVKAREVWRKLAEAAHASGEPGVVFLDRYNKQSTGQDVETLISVNPCGEQGLGAYSVCNLGAMNLDAYVLSPDDSVIPWFDWEAFESDVRVAIEFLDRAIDVNFYFLPENERIQKKLRRVGLSVMGLADALIRLGMRYGSPEAVQFTERVFRTMKDEAIEASVALGVADGPAPAWDDDMWSRPYLREYANRKGYPAADLRMPRLRNLFLLTQAPTGTTSILAGVNSGIEPYFDLRYTRKDRTGEHVVLAPVLDKIGYDGSWTADYLVTSRDVTVEEHIAMQAAVQRYVDSSVSKTINAPADQTVEEVEKAYTLAYESGLKGLAYYRDGSRDVQVLSHEKEDDWESRYWEAESDRLSAEMRAIIAEQQLAGRDEDKFDRPEALSGRTRKVRTRAGSAYVTVNRDFDGQPVEVFISVGKSGSDIMELGEAIGRLASLALRHGASLGGVANQLAGIGGMAPFNKSLPAAVSEALTAENNVPDWGGELGEFEYPPVSPSPYAAWGPAVTYDDPEPVNAITVTYGTCPQCGNMSVVREEGCQKCHLCGWSAC